MNIKVLNVLILTAAMWPGFAYAGEGALITQLQEQNAQREVSVPAPSDFVEAVLPATRASSVPSNLSGEELFQYLHKVTNQAKTHSYNQAKDYMYGTADNFLCDGSKNGILTFYSQICSFGTSSSGNSYKEKGDQNNDGVVDTYINAEHLWPQSFFGKQTPMVSDLHHLQSTFGTPNNRRSNYKFCEVTGNVKYSTSAGSKLGGGCYEPADAVKGNVARSILYFVTRYYDRNIKQNMNYKDFWTNDIDMFLKWNRQDPPDQREMDRNGLIEQFQGNRNPYVDDYTLADKVGASVFKSH